jgi:murein DD-endopeptidase MepM/ murein hydrolase activator NlpD
LRLLAIAALALRVASGWAAPSLSLPLACDMGSACIVQNYVDRDAGPGARDYRCGFLAYDGHKGTDFRVVDRALYRSGVAVLAAAAGRVRAIRDGMNDGERLPGREAGNSVVIEHGDGWETQYAHLRRGSVAVRAGERVQAGDRLGVVGFSGNTEFPHLHFEVRRERKTIDPFAGVEAPSDCHAAAEPLFTARALERLDYKPTGLVNAGFSGARPSVKEGDVDNDATPAFRPSSAAAIFWVQIYGAQAGDTEELKLLAPDGRVLAQRRGAIARNKAQWLAYAGKRQSGAWPSGTYRGSYVLYRGARREKVLEVAREARLP